MDKRCRRFRCTVQRSSGSTRALAHTYRPPPGLRSKRPHRARLELTCAIDEHLPGVVLREGEQIERQAAEPLREHAQPIGEGWPRDARGRAHPQRFVALTRAAARERVEAAGGRLGVTRPRASSLSLSAR